MANPATAFHEHPVMVMVGTAFNDALYASSTAAILVFAGWLSVGVQPVAPMLAYLWFVAQGIPALPPNESLLEFAMRQGGAFAILLVVLWFYRRDYRDFIGFKSDRNSVLTELVREHTKATSEMAAALRENNIIVHQAKNVMREYLPMRREGDE